jgi:hypothetical protein
LNAYHSIQAWFPFIFGVEDVIILECLSFNSSMISFHIWGWRRDNTWMLIIQFKHDFLSYLAVQKIDTYICKTMFTCWVPLFHNGFTLGSMAHATLVIMKLREKWEDYMEIKLHLNGNIEWHCMQLEFKFNANQFKFNWRE